MASLPFSQGKKLKVHCLIVPLKPHLNMHAQTIQTHMHSYPTSGTLPVYSSAMPPQMVPPCLVSVQVACSDPLPVPPSALWMNYDPLLGFFHPPVIWIWTEFCQVVYLSTLRLNIFFAHIAEGGEKVHCCLGTVDLVCCSLSKPSGLWEHNSFA